jgi:flagellar biosynthesis regulator FlaF
MADSEKELSFIETPEERARGTYQVVIKAIRSNGFSKRLAQKIVAQSGMSSSDAEEAVEALVFGKRIECRFLDLFKARMFTLACELDGAVCDIDE